MASVLKERFGREGDGSNWSKGKGKELKNWKSLKMSKVSVGLI